MIYCLLGVLTPRSLETKTASVTTVSWTRSPTKQAKRKREREREREKRVKGGEPPTLLLASPRLGPLLTAPPRGPLRLLLPVEKQTKDPCSESAGCGGAACMDADVYGICHTHLHATITIYKK